MVCVGGGGVAEGAESKRSFAPAHWIEKIAFTPYSRTLRGLSLRFYWAHVSV